jgi:2-haloacid dehalogenase
MKPSVVVFDVNETLSDLSALPAKFTQAGAPAFLAQVWFAGLLRDGFALAAAGNNEKFARIAAESLRGLLQDAPLNRDLDEAVQHIMDGFSALSLHPDVAEGISALRDAGLRLVTLSNGSADVARNLLGSAGLLEQFEHLLSVEDAPAWKPARAAYDYAAWVCETDPDQMILVAVHPWDIHGAKRAGLQTAWLNRSGADYPGYFEAPDHTITSLGELASALEER